MNPPSAKESRATAVDAYGIRDMRLRGGGTTEGLGGDHFALSYSAVTQWPYQALCAGRSVGGISGAAARAQPPAGRRKAFPAWHDAPPACEERVTTVDAANRPEDRRRQGSDDGGNSQWGPAQLGADGPHPRARRRATAAVDADGPA